MALVRVRTRTSWPISSSKVAGRYLRASTRYSALACGLVSAVSELSAINVPGASPRCRAALAKFSSSARDGKAHAMGTGGRLDSDPGKTRYGCFLPDLTGLARRPSAPVFQGEYIRIPSPARKRRLCGRAGGGVRQPDRGIPAAHPPYSRDCPFKSGRRGPYNPIAGSAECRVPEYGFAPGVAERCRTDPSEGAPPVKAIMQTPVQTPAGPLSDLNALLTRPEFPVTA